MKRQLFLPLLLVFALAILAGADERQGDQATGTVDVRLTEYAVEMPHTLPAGPTTFQVHNEGHKRHSFKIQGPGIEQMLEAIVSPRETGTLQITLQPGEYTVFCPIGNHASKGMKMTLEVTAKQQGG